MDNPLLLPILELLTQENNLQHKQAWKVHEILSHLVKEQFLTKLDHSPDKDLFKKNFLIMNALYELQRTLAGEKYLQVHSMDIRLLHLKPIKDKLPETDDPLRTYYLNWSNYNTSEDEIQQLLEQFWLRYSRYVSDSELNLERKEALNIFELPECATQEEIKRKWRKLALKWHPDREKGDKEKFRVCYAAWNTLRDNSCR